MKITFAADLRASRGKLKSGGASGTPVHAGAFLRKREIVLDSELLDDTADLMRILSHELFHFVWRRLDNASRRDWERVLEEEIAQGAAGELGFSSETRKNLLRPMDIRDRSRKWREYACEAFCDTGAWLFFPRQLKHEEFTLGKRPCRTREKWFTSLLGRGKLPV